MALARFVARVIDRLKKTPVDLGLLPDAASRGAILAGGAGVAFFLHELARLRDDPAALALALRWCDTTLRWAAHAERHDWRGIPTGFLSGEGGLRYVNALLCTRSGDREGAVAEVEWIAEGSARLDEATGTPSRPCEFVGGAAGVVCLARDLDARLPSGPDYAAARATLGRVRAHAVEVVLAKYASPIVPGPTELFGFAHGIAGELWALVVALGAQHPTVTARLTELVGLAETDEDGLPYWFASPSSRATEFLGSWCNGMPGHALLWCEVARQLRSEESMTFARKCAESVEVLVNGAPSICCGRAGQAIALQCHAQLTGDANAARRAYARLVGATRIDAEPFLPLWQGTLGVALAAMTRLHGEQTMPFLEPPMPRP